MDTTTLYLTFTLTIEKRLSLKRFRGLRGEGIGGGINLRVCDCLEARVLGSRHREEGGGPGVVQSSPSCPLLSPPTATTPLPASTEKKDFGWTVPSCRFKHPTLLQPAAPRVGTEKEKTILVIKVLSGTTLTVGGFLTKKETD